MTVALVVSLVVILILLIVTNMITLRLLLGREDITDVDGRPDPAATAALTRAQHGDDLGGRTQRVITVEVLNPIDVAATRGRIAGVAGSLAPGLVTRLVHEQTVKTLRQELAAQGVVAEVRLHTVRSAPDETADAGSIASEAPESSI